MENNKGYSTRMAAILALSLALVIVPGHIKWKQMQRSLQNLQHEVESLTKPKSVEVHLPKVTIKEHISCLRVNHENASERHGCPIERAHIMFDMEIDEFKMYLEERGL
eukprot:6077665-Lingulodinium_polyedra.AAC.1